MFKAVELQDYENNGEPEFGWYVVQNGNHAHPVWDSYSEEEAVKVAARLNKMQTRLGNAFYNQPAKYWARFAYREYNNSFMGGWWKNPTPFIERIRFERMVDAIYEEYDEAEMEATLTRLRNAELTFED